MNVVVLFNPRSGRGAAAPAAERAAASLRSAGSTVTLIAASQHLNGELTNSLAGADALVIVGGDGTVHQAADAAIQSGARIWHLPFGTENLFAREFGTFAVRNGLGDCLRSASTARMDVGRCNGRPFLVMCSVGPDASVIHRLARTRTGAIGHLSYVRPMVAEFFRPALAPIRVIADGKTIVDRRPGLLIVANSRQYALRMDPACDASVSDGWLDVVFFPAATSLRVLRWMIAARRRRHRRSKHLVYERAREITIESLTRALPVQLDGEASDITLDPRSPLTISIEPASLSVFRCSPSC